MRFLVIAIAALSLLLGACAQNLPKESTPATTLEPAFYDSIRQRAPRYFAQINTKVLALCINWRNSTPRHAAIEYGNMVMTDRGSRGPVPSRDLRQSAMLNCNDKKNEMALSCDCAIAALGDDFVLQPTAGQLALLGNKQSAPEKFAARQEA